MINALHPVWNQYGQFQIADMVWFSQQFIDNIMSCYTAARDFECVD